MKHMAFQVSKGKIVLIAIIVLVLTGGAAAGVVWGLPAYRAYREDSALMAKVEANPDAKTAYDDIVKNEAEKAKDPSKLAPYVTIGNEWVLIADLLKDQHARDKAIAEYEQGIAVSGDKSTVVILDLGNAYRSSGRFADAEAEYRKMIAIDPGDPEGYDTLIDLYRVDMKKSPEEILPVFKQALETLVDNTPTVQELAGYLASIGRYQDALNYYELLAKKYPDQFDPVVADLKAKIAAAGGSASGSAAAPTN